MKIVKAVQLSDIAYTQHPDHMMSKVAVALVTSKTHVKTVFVERTDTEGFVARKGADLYLGFSGTESIRDILSDAVFIPSRYRYGGWVHSGFNNAIKSIRNKLHEVVSALSVGGGPIENIYGCGHSLGAALVIGAVDELIQGVRLKKVPSVITFGCPNGWSRTARADIDSRIRVCNYINSGDYVTWLLGLTSGRPGEDLQLVGKWGHKLGKYKENICGK